MLCDQTRVPPCGTGIHPPGVLRSGCRWWGGISHEHALYLEGNRKAKVASCVSSRELCRSFMTHTERRSWRTATLRTATMRGRGLMLQNFLHEETEGRSFSNF